MFPHMGASTAGVTDGYQNTIKTNTIIPGNLPSREPGSKSAGENRYRNQAA